MFSAVVFFRSRLAVGTAIRTD